MEQAAVSVPEGDGANLADGSSVSAKHPLSLPLGTATPLVDRPNWPWGGASCTLWPDVLLITASLSAPSCGSFQSLSLPIRRFDGCPLSGEHKVTLDVRDGRKAAEAERQPRVRFRHDGSHSRRKVAWLIVVSASSTDARQVQRKSPSRPVRHDRGTVPQLNRFPVKGGQPRHMLQPGRVLQPSQHGQAHLREQV